MSLTLSVLTFRNRPPQRSISTRFGEVGGTIGRLEQNNLVLPDPERIVSRTHARVDFSNGVYLVTCLGQNPIELNGSPLGAGAAAELASGDRLTIGGYTIVAHVQFDGQGESTRLGEGVAPAPATHQPAQLDFPLSPAASRQMAFGIDLGGGTPASSGVESGQPGHPPLASHGVQRDELPEFLEPLPRVAATSPLAIPEDYDPLRAVAAEGEPTSLQRDPGDAAPGKAFADATPALPPQLVGDVTDVPRREGMDPNRSRATFVPTGPRHRDDPYVQAVRQLLQAAGVPELEDRVLADPDFMQGVGELLQEAVSGLLRALIARALTKRELRVDTTMLATTENNPLKFCPDAFEALSHLLAPRARPGYLPPIRAVREAYEDLQAHNLAVMGGMRAALLAVLQRFDPAQLEKRLASHALFDKLLPQSRKARMWDLVAEQHSGLVREAQSEFELSFGRAFRAAYEEQLQKIRAATSKG